MEGHIFLGRDREMGGETDRESRSLERSRDGESSPRGSWWAATLSPRSGPWDLDVLLPSGIKK